MNKVEIIELKSADSNEFDAVKELFTQMYGYMDNHGLMLDLAEDGPEKWISSVKNMLGRFAVVPIAQVDGQIVGFAHGALRFTSDYLGSRLVGIVTHIYVMQEFRGSGAGKALADYLESWFVTKKVHSVELQVIHGNQSAIGFWEKLGYSRELIQYRKIL